MSRRPAALVDWRRRPRIEYRFAADSSLGEIVHLGHYHHVRAEGGLAPHSHGPAMEFCYLVRGRQTYRVNRRDYRLAGGDLFLTFPEEVHGTGGMPQEKGVLFWLTLGMPRAGATWLGLPPAESAALSGALLGLRRRHFRGTWRVHDAIDRAMDWLRDECDPLRAIAVRTAVLEFLLAVVAAARGAPTTPRVASLAPIARYVEQHLDEPLPLPALAAKAGLSLPRFKASFKEQFGVPPGEYVLRARVAEAVRRLRTTAVPITRVAFDLGFSSSQYFATVVKRYAGRTPRDLRAGRGAV